MPGGARVVFFVLGCIFTASVLWAWYGDCLPLVWINLLGALLAWTCACAQREGLTRVEEQPHERCPICLDPLTGHIVAPPCNHPFHWHCIMRWFDEKESCPLCNHQLETRRFWDWL